MPGHGSREGWLSIPYLRHDDEVLSVRFRCLEDHDHGSYQHGKYMSVKGDRARVYNVKAIHEAEDEIHVSEGEFDALILNQVGMPAVAIPGADGWQGHHRRMLAGFQRVYVWGDPDDAGAEFIAAVCRSLRNARPVQLTAGDVTETYLHVGGAQALRALKKEAAE